MNNVTIKYNVLKLFLVLFFFISLTTVLIFFTKTMYESGITSIKDKSMIIGLVIFTLISALIFLHTVYRVIKYSSPLIVSSEGFFNYPSVLDSGGTTGTIVGVTGFIPWSYVEGIYIESKYFAHRISIQAKYVNIRLIAIPPQLSKGQQSLIKVANSLISISFHLKKESPEEIFHILNDTHNKYKENKNE